MKTKIINSLDIRNSGKETVELVNQIELLNKLSTAAADRLTALEFFRIFRQDLPDFEINDLGATKSIQVIEKISGRVYLELIPINSK